MRGIAARRKRQQSKKELHRQQGHFRGRPPLHDGLNRSIPYFRFGYFRGIISTLGLYLVDLTAGLRYSLDDSVIM